MAKKKTTARATRAPRISKFERAAQTDVQSYLHQNSLTIESRLRVLECEAVETDRAVNQLATALTNMKDRRARLDAQIRGLSAVIARRVP